MAEIKKIKIVDGAWVDGGILVLILGYSIHTLVRVLILFMLIFNLANPLAPISIYTTPDNAYAADYIGTTSLWIMVTLLWGSEGLIYFTRKKSGTWKEYKNKDEILNRVLALLFFAMVFLLIYDNLVWRALILIALFLVVHFQKKYVGKEKRLMLKMGMRVSIFLIIGFTIILCSIQPLFNPGEEPIKKWIYSSNSEVNIIWRKDCNSTSNTILLNISNDGETPLYLLAIYSSYDWEAGTYGTQEQNLGEMPIRISANGTLNGTIASSVDGTELLYLATNKGVWPVVISSCETIGSAPN